MSKLNVNVDVKVPRRTTRDFELKTGTGASHTITVRKLGTMEMIAAASLADSLITNYVTASGDPGTKGYIPPVPLPPVNGHAIAIGTRTVHLICNLVYAQVGEDADRYAPEEWFALMMDPEIESTITEILDWITEGAADSVGADDEEGNHTSESVAEPLGSLSSLAQGIQV